MASAIALLKRIGGDGALQFGPDVGRITRRSGGHHDAADGAARDVAGHLMEVVVTDGRHVVVGDTRSALPLPFGAICTMASSWTETASSSEQVGETECGPVLQGLVDPDGE